MSLVVQLFIWVVGTLVLGVAARRSRTQLGEPTHSLAAFAYYVGIPFAALLFGVMGLDLMALGSGQFGTMLGFPALAWLRGLGITAGVVIIVLVVLALIQSPSPTAITPPQFLNTVYQEIHWSLYRALGTLWFADVYWGAVLGIGLIGLEQALRPNALAQLPTREGRAAIAAQVACVIATSALYVLVQNLWLMVLAHGIIIFANARLQTRARHPQTPETKKI